MRRRGQLAGQLAGEVDEDRPVIFVQALRERSSVHLEISDDLCSCPAQ